jgi:hypothetical protein
MLSILVSLTAGRTQSLVALVVALTSVVLGVLALARSAGGPGPQRGWAITALVVGLIAMILGGRHLASATGPIGSGSGRLGAIVAVAVALVGAVLGALALVRARRTG